MNKRFKQKGHAGFTLIELLVVIVIIGILASVVGPRFFGKTDQAKVGAAKAQIENFCVALDSYELDTGDYPTTQQGLSALISKPTTPPIPRKWNGPYLRKKEVPLDPWENPYVYTYPAKNGPDFDLLSYGKDGKSGGSGDNAEITNW